MSEKMGPKTEEMFEEINKNFDELEQKKARKIVDELIQDVSEPLTEAVREKAVKASEEIDSRRKRTKAEEYIENFTKNYISQQEVLTLNKINEIIEEFPVFKKTIGHKIKYGIESLEKEIKSNIKKGKKDKILNKIKALIKLKDSLNK